MASGGERNNPPEQTNESTGRKKERMYRHTPQQIQELEATFSLYPHPDDKQRARLSRELGLDSRQIKFWFQNRRTLMKAHNEKADNCTLREDNDRIRSENVKMKERLRRTLCNACNRDNAGGNPYFDEQKLRMENARLKEEMYQELQILSPLVPSRELFVLRCSKQIEPSSWVIVDVSVDYLLGSKAEAFAKKLPSGCLVSEMQNGCSKVTWVEHMEIQEKNPIHTFQNLVTTGVAFEARRWVSSLRRMAERNTLFISAAIADDLGGVIPTPEAKQSTMKLTQRMVERFCAAFSGSIANKWIMLSGANDAHQVYFHKANSFGFGGEILSATTSLWLPFLPEMLFSFLKDEQNRNLWEVSDEEFRFQRLAHFVNGSNPGNSISLLNELKSTTNLLILQESCIDATGSLIVYSPLELSTMDKIMRGEDMSSVQFMVSGFMIIPDKGFAAAVGGAMTSATAPAAARARPMGSLLTVGFQMEAADLRKETISAVNTRIGFTVEKIKAAAMASFN